MQAVILGVRQIRSEMNISRRKIPLLLKDAGAEDEALAARHRVAARAARRAGKRDAARRRRRRAAVGRGARRHAHAPGADGRPDRCERRGRAPRQAAREDAGDLGKTRGQARQRELRAQRARRRWSRTERERAAELERTAAGLSAQLERVRALLAP